jgi:hypothetical protein
MIPTCCIASSFRGLLRLWWWLGASAASVTRALASWSWSWWIAHEAGVSAGNVGVLSETGIGKVLAVRALGGAAAALTPLGRGGSVMLHASC